MLKPWGLSSTLNRHVGNQLTPPIITEYWKPGLHCSGPVVSSTCLSVQSLREGDKHHRQLKEFRLYILLVFWRDSPQWARASSFMRFLDHTQRRKTVSTTSLDEWSARRSDLYLTTHNTHNRQTSILPVGFEPTISVLERPQTYALDRAATGIGPMIWS